SGVESVTRVEALRNDRLDAPPALEGVADLCVSNAARSAPIRGLLIGEDKHDVEATGLDDIRQRRHVTSSVVVVEDVEDAAVDCGAKAVAEGTERKNIGDGERGGALPLLGLVSREIDGTGRQVDAEHFEAESREPDGVLTGSAPDVDHRRSEL